MTDLSNKVALVTGAGTSIGLAIATALAEAGAAALINDIDADLAERAAAGLRDRGARVVAFGGDAASVATCQAMVARCVATFGGLDICCCNAGITTWGAFLDTTEESFDRVVAVNLKGTYFLTQAAARQMIRQGRGGRILLTASVTGVQAVEYLSAYGMTKAGIRMLARNLVVELSPHGITVNAIAPGSIVNERNLANEPLYAEKWASAIPVGRVGYPEDIAAAALFLASDAAGFVNGQTLIVDGGWTATSPAPRFEFVEGQEE